MKKKLENKWTRNRFFILRLILNLAFFTAVALNGCQRCYNKIHQHVKSKEDAFLHYKDYGNQIHELSKFLFSIIPDSTKLRIMHNERCDHLSVTIFDDSYRDTILFDSILHRSLTKDCIMKLSVVLQCKPTEVSDLFCFYEQTDCIALLYPINILDNPGLYLKYRHYSHFHNFKCGFYIFNTPFSKELKDAVNGALEGRFRSMEVLSDSALLWF